MKLGYLPSIRHKGITLSSVEVFCFVYFAYFVVVSFLPFRSVNGYESRKRRGIRFGRPAAGIRKPGQHLSAAATLLELLHDVVQIEAGCFLTSGIVLECHQEFAHVVLCGNEQKCAVQ